MEQISLAKVDSLRVVELDRAGVLRSVGAASTGERAKAAAVIRECDQKLNRYRALLEAGTDPLIVASWISEVEGERRRAQAVMEAATRKSVTTTTDVRHLVEDIGGLTGLLR